MSLAHDGTILLTGVAGFIGYHLAERLLDEGCRVVGVDSLNEYYDPRLKRARLDRLLGRAGFDFRQVDLGQRVEDREITLDEGLAELRHYEGEIRSMLKR